MKKKIVIIGGGPGGYVAALKAGIMGAETVLIEKDKVGGVCLQRGCIPTKALIASAEILEKIKKASSYGIEAGEAFANFSKMNERKDRIVEQLTRGIEFLLKKRDVKLVSGAGYLKGTGTVGIIGSDESFEADAVILATGSQPLKPGFVSVNGDKAAAAEECLQWKEVPDDLLIVGGGVIGLEMGCLFRLLGSNVTIIEMMDFVLPGFDLEMSSLLAREMKKKGIKIITGCACSGIEETGGKLKVSFISKQTQKEETIETSKVLVAVGRKLCLEGIGIEEAQLTAEPFGLKVNSACRTSNPGIYAIGDITGPPFLAHRASAQAEVAVENIMGTKSSMDGKIVPNCIFTLPEYSSAGLTEEECKDRGIEYAAGRYPFRALGKAHALGDIEGQIKVISRKENGEILGIHILGHNAGELIAAGVIALQNKWKVRELAETIYMHPTMSEAFKEAALATFGESLHFI